MKEEFKEIMKNEDLIVEQASIAATFMYKYYQQLMDKGFNPEQTLRIVINHGIDIGKMNN
jgi:hypothetical protein